MEKRALLLINRHARRGKQGFAQAIDLLDDLGFELITVPVKSSKSPAEYIHYYAHQIDLVIVGGGDGTLNAVVNSLVEHQLPLGILPLGTANDLARTLGLPLAIAPACQVIAEGHCKAIDLGKVNGRYFFNVASLGLSAEITQQLTKGAKQRWGVLAYALTALRVLSQTRPFHATIRANGEEFTVKTLQVAVGNGLYYGGGLAIAADATIDDQCLDLYSLNVQHWWQIFYLLFHLPKGKQKFLPWVSTLKAQSIEVITRKARDINTDGEITTHTPANFTVVPRILQVFTPQNLH